jgi:hypothetical protein
VLSVQGRAKARKSIRQLEEEASGLEDAE